MGTPQPCFSLFLALSWPRTNKRDLMEWPQDFLPLFLTQTPEPPWTPQRPEPAVPGKARGRNTKCYQELKGRLESDIGQRSPSLIPRTPPSKESAEHLRAQYSKEESYSQHAPVHRDLHKPDLDEPPAKYPVVIKNFICRAFCPGERCPSQNLGNLCLWPLFLGIWELRSLPATRRVPFTLQASRTAWKPIYRSVWAFLAPPSNLPAGKPFLWTHSSPGLVLRIPWNHHCLFSWEIQRTLATFHFFPHAPESSVASLFWS